MKTLLRYLWMPVVALVAAPCFASHPASALPEVAKPVAVFSVASTDRLMDDLAYFTQTSGRNDVGGIIRMVGAPFLEYIDRTKPAGVIISVAGDEPKGIGFLPVPDLDGLLKFIKDKFGFPVDHLENGMKKLELGEGAYFKQQGDWLFFSDSPKHLVNLPEDPVKLLDGLNEEYGISFRVFVRNVPPQFRKMLIDRINNSIQSDLVLKPGDDPNIEGEFLQAFQTHFQNSVTSAVSDSEKVTIGWAVDASGNHTYTDFEVTAVEGSPLSKQLDWLTDTRSSLTGFFMSDAAATVRGSARISSQTAGIFGAFSTFIRKKAIKGIEEDPNAPEALTEIVNAVLNVVDKTISEGKTDVGTAVVLAPNSFKFVGGVRIADGDTLAGAFEKLVELVKGQPGVPDVDIRVEKYEGIDLHTFSVPLPEEEKDARKVLGENLDVVVGIGPENLFFGFGAGSETLLKQVIEDSLENGEKPVPPAHFELAIRPLVRFLTSIDPDNESFSAWATALAETRGGDGISVTVTTIENGLRCRFRVEEGVLEMLGKASRSADGSF